MKYLSLILAALLLAGCTGMRASDNSSGGAASSGWSSGGTSGAGGTGEAGQAGVYRPSGP